MSFSATKSCPSPANQPSSLSAQNAYVHLSSTIGLCDVCLQRIDAKIVLENGQIFIIKTCTDHGLQKHLLEESADYYLQKPHFDKPATRHENETQMRRGCPFDCGLCPQHEQHTCIGLVEITTACNMACPLCYASCGESGSHLPLATIEGMIDFFIQSEGGKGEVLQISGGEPTLHPNIIDILTLCKQKNIGHVMLNTNGIRIAQDSDFVASLAPLTGGFEVYLQFDALSEGPYKALRQQQLLEIKKKAIENLNQYNIPTTLVTTVEQGVNDHLLGELIDFGLKTPCVRGISLQPAARFGAHENAPMDALTVSGIINRIQNTTSGLLKSSDFVPLPCNVERVAVTYLYKKGKSFIPITRNRNIQKYVPFISNTFLFHIEDALKDGKAPRFGFCDCLDFLNDFVSVVPKGFLKWDKDQRVKYLNENTFRISIASFVDRQNFEVKSMQKECVHVITPDHKRIPFSAYNLLHRKKYE